MIVHENLARCPHCGRLNEADVGPGVTAPKSGDWTFCWKCHGIARFRLLTGVLVLEPVALEDLPAATQQRMRQVLAALTESTRPSEAVALAGDLLTDIP